jgi:hypothetical protein
MAQIIRPDVADQARAEAWYGQQAQGHLEEFRRRHQSQGWFYQLLDVAWGMELAADDVARLTRRPAAIASLIVTGALAIIFTGIWLRYDLLSTWTVLAPLAKGVTDAFVRVFPASWGITPGVTVLGSLFAWFIGLLFTLGPTLIQVGMPYMSQRHGAAWLALWLSALFDMATDSVDVRNDVPNFFGWLIQMATQASSTVWLSLIALGVFLLVIRNRQWPLWTGLIIVAVACLGWGQAGNIVYWANVLFWTFFASFASQSLAFIFLGKGVLLFAKAQTLRD